jgi:WD40 repeat protein
MDTQADAPRPAGGDAKENASGPLKVFISYSRVDVGFADELELALEDKGFKPLIDRHDVVGGEEFERRLLELILASDTVVFVLTEASAKAPYCAWEVERAEGHGKRILVVTPGPVPSSAAPPPQLARLNWIHCWRNPAVPGSSQTKGFRDLDTALRTDAGWLRQRTELQQHAARWTGRGGAADSPHLLRGDVLGEALAWAREAPLTEQVPAEVAAFLAAGETYEARLAAEAQDNVAARVAALMQAQRAAGLAQAAAERQQRAERGLRVLGVVALVVGLLLSAGAATGGWFAWRFQQEAERQTAEAELQTAVAARRSSDILARVSKAIAETGVHETALLMALQADPLAQRSEISRRFDGDAGYAFASARLAAAHANMRLTHLLEGQGGTGPSAAFSPDGGRIVTASLDGTAQLWDAATGEPLAILQGHRDAVFSAAFAPDGRRVVTASLDGTARLWDAATGEPLAILEGHGGRVLSADFAPDGGRIVTASDDGTARLWDAATGEPLAALEGHGDPVFSAAFAPDSGRIVTASLDGTARLWDAATGEPLAALEDHGGPVFSAAFAPDGRRVVTASDDGTARLWDAATGEPLAALEGHGDAVLSAAFAPDGGRIVTASNDGTARLWDAATGGPLAILEGHGGGVQSAAFAPDGDRIITASVDGTARLWDAATGEPLAALEGHGGAVTSAAFAPDGDRIVTDSSDGTTRLWEVPPILLTGPQEQVRLACETLWKARAPLAFTRRDAQRYPVLAGEPVDPETGDFVSPCQGVLPNEAFARAP